MNRRILLIDESAMLRRIVASVLQAAPNAYEVTTATRATEGFAIACTSRIDLILMDGGAVDAGRLEACRRLLGDPRTAKIPVVLLLGRGSVSPQGRVFPDNVVGSLVKPFAPEEVVGIVHAIFDFTRRGLTLSELRNSLQITGLATPKPTSQVPDQSSERTDKAGVPGNNPESFTRQPEAHSWHGRDFALSGEANLTSLRAVMHAAADTGLTGALRFRIAKEVHTEALFDEGRMVVISTRDAQSYAARAFEAVPTKVSEATLDDAVAEQAQSGTPFLLTLGTHGLLSKATATLLLDRFGQRHFAKLWTYRHHPSLRYDFEALEALPSYALRLPPLQISLDEWLLQSTRHLRQEEIAPLLRHEGTVGTPLYQTDGEALARVLTLTGEERDFLRLVHPRHDLPAIAQSLKISQEAAYVILHRLRCVEILHYRTAPAAFVMTPRTFSRRVLPLER